MAGRDHPNVGLVRAFYDTRSRGDLDAVRKMLDEDVLWREPEVGNEHTGDLRGVDAMLGMIREAGWLTGGTFELRVSEAVAHGEQVAAFIDWSATRDGRTLEGKEIAIYRIRDDKIVEAYFHQDNIGDDEEFWSSG